MPFEIVGISADTSLEDAVKAVEDNNLSWKIVWDGEGGEIAKSWYIDSWPKIYLIDAEGVIRVSNYWGGASQYLVDEIETLMKETGHDVDLSDLVEQD